MAEALSMEEVQAILDASPYISAMGLQVVSMDPARQTIVIRMAMQPQFERRGGTGQFHGGAISALIDIAGDYALVMSVGGGVPTVNFRTDFLRPATETGLTATATVRRAGRTYAVVDIDVQDDEGRLIAVGRGTYGTARG